MKYRVTWDPDAFRRLRGDWIAAQQSASGIQAFDEIELTLQVDAEQQGEGRPDGRRILIVSPIGVIFRANKRLREVIILDAWMFRKRR